MPKSALALGSLVTSVVLFVGLIQAGVLQTLAGESAGPQMHSRSASVSDVFSSEAGWRYQRGQPNHWKYLVMQEP